MEIQIPQIQPARGSSTNLLNQTEAQNWHWQCCPIPSEDTPRLISVRPFSPLFGTSLAYQEDTSTFGLHIPQILDSQTTGLATWEPFEKSTFLGEICDAPRRIPPKPCCRPGLMPGLLCGVAGELAEEVGAPTAELPPDALGKKHARFRLGVTPVLGRITQTKKKGEGVWGFAEIQHLETVWRRLFVDVTHVLASVGDCLVLFQYSFDILQGWILFSRHNDTKMPPTKHWGRSDPLILRQSRTFQVSKAPS